MANISEGTYVVEGLKINVDALKVFSSLLPSTALNIVEWAEDIVVHLPRIPANRNEITLFQTYLLKSLTVVVIVLYELTIGVQGPPNIPTESQKTITCFERALNDIRKEFSNLDSAAPSQSRHSHVKKGLLVASPKTRLLQNSLNSLRRAAAPFHVETNFLYAARLSMVVRRARRFSPDPLLETLPRAKYARFDCERPDRPASCLKGTREGIIKDTIEWIVCPGDTAKRFFWLKGLAGTGKTTMAHSIATIAQNLGILGASFLFSRRGQADLRDPACVFPTIAYQLALFDPNFHEPITAALKAEPQAPTASLGKQLDSLIVGPLSKLKTDNERVVVIVFDGFDECEAAGARAILQLLVEAIPSLPFFLKIFVTSRPEPHIRSVLIPSNENLQITALHEIKSSIVQGDILLYLRTELRKLPKKRGMFLEADWVTEVEIELLSHASGELFIYAATLLRALDEAYSLRRMLDVLLKLATKPRSDHERSNPFVYLDELYMEILRITITPANKVQALELLQVFLGTIVLLRGPLPVDALEQLVGMCNGDAVTTLNSLHSVILPPAPPDYCPRVYHKSFSDFLQDPARCTDPSLFIDTQKHETHMAIRCLALLNAKLHKGMLGKLDPTTLNSEVQGLKEKVRDTILVELQYACRHWASHLAKACHQNAEIKIALEEFASKNMLAWMEAISWLGYAAPCTTCLDMARAWAARSGASEEIVRLLDDGHQLLLAHNPTIALGAQHVWQSVLPFAPANVTLTSRYKSYANACVKVVGGVESDWPSCLTAWEGHNRAITSIAFSPDGTRLASGSYDRTVRLWNPTTGACTATLTGHTNWVAFAIFSPDGTRLASGSKDNTVRLWDATTGILTAKLIGHSGGVTVVAFSTDSAHLASGSYDKTVRLWDATTGACTVTLAGHTNWVASVIFVPGGTHIQSQAHDPSQTIVWNIHTGSRAESEDWKKVVNYSGQGTSSFKHVDGWLHWTPRHASQRLICALPPRENIKEIHSRRLREGVEVVAITGWSRRLIILHVRLPRAKDT